MGILTTWSQQAGERLSPRQNHSVYYDLTSEMTFHRCCIFLVTQTNPSTTWEGTTQDVNTTRQGSLGLYWRLATTLGDIISEAEVLEQMKNFK